MFLLVFPEGTDLVFCLGRESVYSFGWGEIWVVYGKKALSSFLNLKIERVWMIYYNN